MSDKFQNKYRIPSARLEGWNYSNNAAYFITICTENMEHHFGEVVNGEMELNKIGKLAYQFWEEIPQHFPFVVLDEFIVMPNHVHGILLIENNKGGDNMHGKVVSKKKEMISNDFEKPSLGFIQKRMGEISPKAGSVSVVIRSFKSITTKMARKVNADFKWQSRFYDHIIRNDESFCRIAEYIKNNPNKWQEDRFYE